MKTSTLRKTSVVALLCVAGAGLMIASTAALAAKGETVLNYAPHMIIEDEAAQCAQCHERAVEAWSQSTHKKTYDELHLRERAAEIVEKMGGRSIRRSAECVQCHYTMAAKTEGGRAKAVMGVSCQRCHGEALNWLEIHQDTDRDKTERLKEAEENGMRPTYNIHQLASSCFQCHTVPREELVNTGGHVAGSEFDLVSWSQGEVRHNFLPLPDEAANRESTNEGLQLLFVMGKILDLEFSLRGLANATTDGDFATAMIARVEKAREGVKALGLGLGEIDTILGAVPGELKPGDADACTSAADAISKAAQEIESSKPDLSSVAGQLPSKDSYKGTAYE